MPEPQQFGPPSRIITQLEQIDGQVLEAIAAWVEGRGIRVPVGQIVGYQNERQAVKTTPTTTSIPSGTETLCTYSGVDYDASQMWLAGTPGMLTARTPGVYLAIGFLQWASNATGVRMGFVKNDPNNIVFGADKALPSATDNAPWFTVAALIKLAVGQSAKLTAFQDTGGDLNVTGTLSMALVNRYI